MRSDVRVPERMHHLKAQLEDVVQLRLVKVQRQQVEVDTERLRLEQEYERALGARNQCRSGREWWLWQLYADALRIAQGQVEGRLAGLRHEAEVQRRNLHQAHREQLRWEVLLRERKTRLRQAAVKAEQRELDETGMQMRVRMGGDGDASW
ncbi:MAG: hypothetical protein K6T63_06955 [Alicyclobacillus herbarius]|uniref:hypothetical protein n=1 Tax=Alicyclobacillus herbarius TaxID=122960 RepID=UPI0023569DB7|nr:hypothetical protein [Alicyclobacillus herbarius]MCL6632360.1 hypothetical protein [Alicyclobacillus herbarius]